MPTLLQPHLAACRLLLASFATALSVNGIAGEVVHVLVEDGFSPWSDDRGEGRANELVRAAFGAVHVDVQLSVVPYARCRTLVIKGLAPSCFSMSPSKDLNDAVRFSDRPLYAVTLHALVSTPAGWF